MACRKGRERQWGYCPGKMSVDNKCPGGNVLHPYSTSSAYRITLFERNRLHNLGAFIKSKVCHIASSLDFAIVLTLTVSKVTAQLLGCNNVNVNTYNKERVCY